MLDYGRRLLLQSLLATTTTRLDRLRLDRCASSSLNITPFRTPYKFGKLVLARSSTEGSFDSQLVDDPFVFWNDGRFWMMYTGYDGTGYQTGLAESSDLVNWSRLGLIFRRNPQDATTRYNAALLSILRENELLSSAPLKKVNGRYLGAWNAYPRQGYEAGPGVIGLAWSDDLFHWERTEPVLRPEQGADWEKGGLYRPYLMRHEDTYYLFYNARNAIGDTWIEQIGFATSRNLLNWTRYPHNPIIRVGGLNSWDSGYASNPLVLHHSGRWVLYYFGFDCTHARELMAIGKTPSHFDKVPEILVDVGRPGSVDEIHAHKPSVVYHEGDLYHFYCAVSGDSSHEMRGISVSRSRPW